MQRTRWGLLATGLGLLISGCSEPATTETTGTQTSEGAAAVTAGGENAAASTAGSENAVSETAAATTPEETPQQTATAADGLTGDDVATTLLEGLESRRGLKEAFDEARANYLAKPTDQDASLSYMALMENLGLMHAQMQNTAKAHQAFQIAVKVLDKAKADNVEIPQVPFIGMVYYNSACALAASGDTAGAMNQLETAFTSGFNDINTLENDTDLAAVRALPDFSSKLESWKTAAAEALRAHAREELASGETFPFTFELTNVLDGSPVKLSDHSGKVCIVDIWGTWCGPCVGEIPSFIALQEKFGPSGFQMIGLNSEHGADDAANAEKVSGFIAEHSVNYPCALISDEVLASVPDLQGYPTTLFIDRTGKVRMKLVGAHEYGFLEAVVEALMAEGSGPATESGD